MRIVLASSEAVPYSKTGGLADVSGALAKALAAAGHTVTLVVPHYPQLQRKSGRVPLDVAGPEVVVRVGDRDVSARLHWAALPGSEATVLFVDCPQFFDRPALYGDANGDYGDNAARFCFFSRVVLEACRALVLRPDVIHANDWQTGAVPALLESEYRGRPGFERTASVFTIHNLAYQGHFPWWDFGLTGLDWKYFTPDRAEHWGGLNLLKLGIATADQVTTVSPTYAWEITTPLGGMGLEGVLATRKERPRRHPERHRPGRVERRDRRAPADELRRRDGLQEQAGVQALPPAGDEPADAGRRAAVRHGQPDGGPEGLRPDRDRGGGTCRAGRAVRVPRQRRPAVRVAGAAPVEQPPR